MMPAQRELCLKLRGNLTQRQSAIVAAVSLRTWRTWEGTLSPMPPKVAARFEADALSDYPHYRSGPNRRKVQMRRAAPILFAQRAQCIAARGNLSQLQAAQVAGYSYSYWKQWENEKVAVPEGILGAFRAAAKRKFPWYRSDLRDF